MIEIPFLNQVTIVFEKVECICLYIEWSLRDRGKLSKAGKDRCTRRKLLKIEV